VELRGVSPSRGVRVEQARRVIDSRLVLAVATSKSRTIERNFLVVERGFADVGRILL
jgi:hypothetical protein